MKDEALKLALEALEGNTTNPIIDPDQAAIEDQAINAIKQALALDKKAENARELGLDYEPVLKDNSNYRYDPPIAEPVAYLCENAVGHKYFRWKKPSSEFKPIALYTTPPAQRQWTGLTDEDVYPLANEHLHYQIEGYEVSGIYDLARAIEAKLKEKNT
jgi:hypothetical protein